MTVLLAENQQLAANHMMKLLKEVGFPFNALAHVQSVKELKAWLSAHPVPDLLLLDNQLKDGVSIEVFDQLNLDGPVIFTTVYDESVIKTFQQKRLDYLLKPLEKEALRAALQKYAEVFRFHHQHFNVPPQEKRERIVVKKGNARLCVPIHTIAFFYAEMKLTFAVDFAGNRFSIDQNLSHLDPQLDRKLFFRLSRQIIANVNAICEFRPVEFSRIELSLVSNNYIENPIIISQFTAPDFKKWIYSL